ncbi:MAG: conjugal transfer protein TraX [Spirochaetaceae bacterium]|jgi:hypothetical protein|nr:conjugal transfer protein TraX [Spirochaetaceae bacterium]
MTSIHTTSLPSGILKAGISGAALKTIGVIMMGFDHVHQMFTDQGIPIWFTWIGRPVLPLFLFLCAEGYFHTRSRLQYLITLFIGFELMNIISFVLSDKMPNENIVLMNNVFQTLFMAGVYMRLIDMVRAALNARRPVRAASVFVLMALPCVFSTIILLMPITSPRWLMFVCYKFMPSVMATEGGFTAILMGVLFYLLRKHRLAQAFVVVIMGLLSLGALLLSGKSPFNGNAQWLMMFAAFFIVCYNGKRGRTEKYFFYIFYPAHIYLLYLVACFIR